MMIERSKLDKAISLLNTFSRKAVMKNKENIIFLPKIVIEEQKCKLKFPVFNNNGELNSWLVYNFNIYVFEDCKEEIKISLSNMKELDFNEKKYNQCLDVLVDILNDAKKLARFEKESFESEKILKTINEKINEYNKIIFASIKKELNIIYLDSKKENNNSTGENIIFSKNNSKVSLESSNISEKLIELSKSIKIQEIDFEWEQSDGLRYVADESLELAYEILKRAEISLQIEKEKIKIINNIYNICNKEISTKELIEEIKQNKNIDKKNTDFIVKKELTINRICYKCNYQKCPKHLVGYIYYLINKGLLEEKLEDREKFKKENDVNDIYAFDWKFGDVLKLISDDMYNYAYELVKRNLIYTDKYLVGNSITIYSAMECKDYKVSGGQIDKIPNINKEFGEWVWISRNPNNKIGLCNSYICGLKGCPIAIAGIIQYLIYSGKEDVLKEERDYYHKNKFEMNRALDDIIRNQKNEIEKNNEKMTEKLAIYKKQINNFDELISTLTNTDQNNLHCTIEGEESTGKKELINNIVDILYEKEKLNLENGRRNYSRISLQNLASSNSYFDYNKQNTAVRDAKGTLYQTQAAAKYTTLKERKIYIVNGISEFIRDYKGYENLGTFEYSEVRKKQFKHAIKLLTEIGYRNYIILDGTKEEIDQLLELDPKLQFIYKNYRFKFPDISLDEVFEMYKKDLNKSILSQLLRDEKKYKEQFLEYLSLNKNFVPFTNGELASYLAMYSNSKDAIVFPENIYKKESVEEALENIIGLETVKKKVKEFEKYMMFKVKAETLGLKLAHSNMHMVFTGNPGSGKTMIARIMAKMLFDLGIIKENKLIEVERKDLVGAYIGQTAPKTSEVIQKAMGGVLFIDEAYALSTGSSNDFGGEAISTLIKAMEDHKDNLVVIFAGYKDEMKRFIDSNPGISSRIGYSFDFPDYSVEELTKMFEKKITNMGFEYNIDCIDELKKICSYFSKRKAFGNGRFIDKVIQEVILKHAINEHNDIKKIDAKDIPQIKEFNNASDSEESTEELLKSVVGLDKLKEKIKEFEEYVKFLKEAEKNNIKIPNQNMHMIFTGNPGTGKTTIARIMAKILYNTGVLQENKLIEVERKDLIAGYVGQTAPKTMEVIEKAMGGVLFIDEAYSLASNNSSNDFGGEAIATLIKSMEDHKGEFIVIFAGYEKEMGEFINTNSGIMSRIGYTFNFEDYTREELAEILYKKLEKSNLQIEEMAQKQVSKIMNYFCNVENIGNGRFVDKVFQEILLKHSKNKTTKINEIQEADIPSIEEMTNCIYKGEYMIKPDQITKEALEDTAIHEIGHAFVRYKLFENPGIVKITVNPEGNGALGYVQYKTMKEGYVQKKTVLLNRIKTSLAGMAAEEIFTGEFANGNTSDLENATEIARNMITRYGMSSIGFGQLDKENTAMATKVQEEINSMLSECYTETLELIKNNKDVIRKVVDYLLEHKEINEEQFLEILKKI